MKHCLWTLPTPLYIQPLITRGFSLSHININSWCGVRAAQPKHIQTSTHTTNDTANGRESSIHSIRHIHIYSSRPYLYSFHLPMHIDTVHGQNTHTHIDARARSDMMHVNSEHVFHVCLLNPRRHPSCLYSKMLYGRSRCFITLFHPFAFRLFTVLHTQTQTRGEWHKHIESKYCESPPLSFLHCTQTKWACVCALCPKKTWRWRAKEKEYQ